VRELVIAKVKDALGLYSDLAAALPEEALRLNLPHLPSNTIGSQLWCVAGARASYLKAIRAGTWQGFACEISYAEAKLKDRIGPLLESTAGQVVACLEDVSLEWTVERERLLLSVLEHEVQHHGQLIRYLYGNRLEIPRSWKERYSLD